MQLQLPGIIFLAIVIGFLLFIIFQGTVAKRRRTMGRRMEDVIAQPVSGFDEVMARELTAQVIAGKRAERLQVINELFRGKTFFRKIESSLIAAGVPLKPAEFVGIVLLSTIILTLIGFLVSRKILMTLIFAFIGYRLPLIILGMLRKRRIRIFEAQLCDALTMIASGLRAGYSFLQGISSVANQMSPPISDEFRRAVRSTQLGMEIREALQRMGQRVQSYDLDMAVTACCVQLQTGGNLSQLLEVIAQTIRARIKLRREISAATAQGRMSGAILVLLPVGIAISLRFINPDYASLLTTTDLGRGMIKTAIIMQLIGVWLINRLLQFEG